MFKSLRAILALLVLSLTGCTTFSPVVERLDVPRQDRGYLLGRFTQNGDWMWINIGLRILYQDPKGGEEKYYIKFGPDSPDPTDNIIAMSVAPGRYQIQGFVFTWVNGLGYNLTRSEPLIDKAKRPYFNVEAGKLYYIGDYTGDAHINNKQLRWKVTGYSYSPDETIKMFLEFHPSFRNMRVVK